MGTGTSVIRVTVAAESLESGVGLARIDGQSQPISIDTVKSLLKTGRVVRIPFDAKGNYAGRDGGGKNSGRRLFTARQREILAVKFGGCMDPACDRPPSWCEAHHIAQVYRDGGTTIVVNGILLCKFHHLKYHNDGYEILACPDGTYWRVPPANVDPDRVPILMPLKTRNLIDLENARQRNRAS